MNQGKSSKFVPGLPDDEPSNKNIPTAPDSTINIFEGVAECTMKDSDNLKSVKIQAKKLAEDNVQKQIAEYIRAFLKDRYLTLPDDETLSIANEISTINDVKYNTRDSDDDIVIRATVTAQLDNKDIMNYIIRFFKERAELKSEIVALRKEIEELKLQEDKVSSEKSALATQNKDLKSQNDVLRNKTVALNNQIDSLNNQLRDKQNAIDGLNGQLRDKQNAIDSLNGQLRDKQNAIDGLNGELRDKQKTIDSLNGQLRDKQNAIDSLNGQLRDKQNAIDELKRQVANRQTNTSQVVSKDKIATAKQKYDKARELVGKGRYEDAIILFDEAIQLNPNDEYAYNHCGLACKNLRQYERAIKYFNKAIQLSPNFEAAYYNRGKCYQGLGEYAKAQADIKKSEELGNQHNFWNR